MYLESPYMAYILFKALYLCMFLYAISCDINRGLKDILVGKRLFVLLHRHDLQTSFYTFVKID